MLSFFLIQNGYSFWWSRRSGHECEQRITQLRTAYGISQYALWKRSGIAQGALSQYESGAKTPGVDTLERICGALGVTLADFFSPDAALALPSGMSSLSTEERELLGCYRMLTRTQQEDALLILRTLARKPRRVTARQFLLYYMLPADEKPRPSMRDAPWFFVRLTHCVACPTCF